MDFVSRNLLDPMRLAELLWPDDVFYKDQVDIIYSVKDNDETYVPAGNMLGKDYIAAFIAVWIFLSAIKTGHTCRIVSTSVKDEHLMVLWSEIAKRVTRAKYPLTHDKGGPLVLMNKEIRRTSERDQKNPTNYLTGMVSQSVEGSAGHHAEITLGIGDEASGLSNTVHSQFGTWAKRRLWIGNCNPSQDFFFRDTEAGDLADAESPGRYFRKVIRIRGHDSPNVRLALMQQQAGKKPTGEILVPGVLSWDEYRKRMATWDKVRVCIGIDAQFWKGASLLLFPPDWLNHSEQLALKLRVNRRQAKAIGIDPAEGGDKTAMAAIDEYGLIELVSKQTPDTSVITGEALAFMRKHGVPANRVCFDRGGGGKEHADRLRAQGHEVRTVGFGEGVALEPRRGMNRLDDRLEVREERYAYKDRRAQMYHELSQQMDPNAGDGFAIPAEETELRRQLAIMPKKTDGEGRYYLPPKNKKKPDSDEECLSSMLGCSPDEADALVLAFHAMTHKGKRVIAGAY